VVPLECRDAPVALALPGVDRVFSVPGLEEGAVLVGDDASAGVGRFHVEIDAGNVAANLRSGSILRSAISTSQAPNCRCSPSIIAIE